MTHEIEYKWKAHSIEDYEKFLSAAAKLKAQLSPPQRISIRDFYLDTPDHFFGNSRTKCRIRMTDKKSELTLKSFSISEDGLVIRQEKNIPLPRFNSIQNALEYCRKKTLRDLIGHNRIQTIFKLENNRLLHKLTLPGGITAEACYDDVTLSRGSKKARMNEIELELLRGNLNRFKSFAKKLTQASKLKTAERSKFATAMSELFGENRIPSDPKLASYPYRYTQHDSMGFAAIQVIGANLKRLKANETGVRLGFDNESLHDMRVSARRIRAAIRVFKQALPKRAQRTGDALRDLGWTFGRKRDLDVLSAYADLSNEIKRAHQAILDELNSKHYSGLIRSIEKIKGKSKKLNAKKLIHRRLEKTLKLAKNISLKSTDKELHALRISIKKLRYACEFLEPVSSGKTKQLIKDCRSMQDILGDHQDAIFGLRRFPQNKLLLRKKKLARREFFKNWEGFSLRLLRF